MYPLLLQGERHISGGGGVGLYAFLSFYFCPSLHSGYGLVTAHKFCPLYNKLQYQNANAAFFRDLSALKMNHGDVSSQVLSLQLSPYKVDRYIYSGTDIARYIIPCRFAVNTGKRWGDILTPSQFSVQKLIVCKTQLQSC